MGITQSAVLAGAASTTDGTSYNTASAAPGADNLLLFYAVANFGVSAPDINISGGPSVTWEAFLSAQTLSNQRRVKIWAALAGPTPGSGVITIAAAGTTMTGCAWGMTQFPGTYIGASALDSLYGLLGPAVAIGQTTIQQAPGPIEGALDATLSIVLANVNAGFTGERTELCDVGHASPAQRLVIQFTVVNDTDGPVFNTAGAANMDCYSFHMRDAANPPVTFKPYPVTVTV